MKLRMTKARAVLAAAALAVPTVVLPVQSASAAYPNCTGNTVRSHYAKTNTHVNFPGRSGSVNCELGDWLSGSRLETVKILQRALNTCYLKGLAVDGSYGPATKAAVKSVQRQHGINPDGGYGPDTRRAMNWPAYTTGGVGAGCLPGKYFTVS